MALKGIEFDPYYGRIATQDFKRCDHTEFKVDTKLCNKMSSITAGSTAYSVDILWQLPVVKKNETETFLDTRGAFNKIYDAHVKVTNMVLDPVDVKINSPRSSIIGSIVDYSKINSRENAISTTLKPGKSTIMRTNFTKASIFAPCIKYVTTKDPAGGESAIKVPHLVLASFVVNIPDINTATGVVYSSDNEVVEVDVDVYYRTQSDKIKGAVIKDLADAFCTVQRSYAEAFSMDPIDVQPAGFRSRARSGPAFVVADSSFKYNSIGYEFVRVNSEKGPYDLRAVLVGDKGEYLQFPSVESSILQSYFGPSVQKFESGSDYGFIYNQFKYDRNLGAWVAWNSEKNSHASFTDWPVEGRRLGYSNMTSFQVVNNNASTSIIPIALVIATLSCLSKILGIIGDTMQSHHKGSKSRK